MKVNYSYQRIRDGFPTLSVLQFPSGMNLHERRWARFYSFVLITIALMFAGCVGSEISVPDYRLWYEQPADQWEETLPLGNGRIGIMPDGQVVNETVVLNDITLWSGGVQDANNPDAAKYLPEIQRLLFEGRNDEAQALVHRTFVCKGEGSGHGRGADLPFGSFELLGNLRLNYYFGTTADYTDYYRELNLDDATSLTSFELDGVKYRREYFTSFTDDVALIRLTADKKGKISLSVGIDRPRAFETRVTDNMLVMTGQLNNGTDGKGMRYLAKVKPVLKGGTLTSGENSLIIENANEVILFISMGTDFRNPGFEEIIDQKLKKAVNRKFRDLKKSHIAEYQSYFNRVRLNLAKSPEREMMPTDRRLIAFADDPSDNGLVDLYFQYGRYLLISSAHAQVLPPNLQGLWANTIQTPWNGDYHLNINVQMNHWPAEITNLPELHRPLIEFTKTLEKPGAETARIFYNANGWVAHMMTNVWGFTAPGEHPSWGATNTGGAWLMAHLWEHYEFNRDDEYLREIYPLMKGAAQFFLDVLVTDPNTGWLVTAPSTSPENAFYMPGTEIRVSICMGPTMDNQIVRELFRNTKKAASILSVDDDFSAKLAEASAKLPPNQIGSDGRLMEWLEEYVEVDPRHRHVSHLYGLHPGNEITPEFTPELAEAARKTLYVRGDGGTGWSRAWKINFWARLHDGNHAFTMVKNLLEPAYETGFDMANKGGTYANLLCAHPPFQIDGNFGGTAGIAQMFVQSHAGFVNFIPALPDQFADGSFSGLRVRGEGIVAAEWQNKQLKKASLKAEKEGSFIVKLPENAARIKATVGRKRIEPQVVNQMMTIDLKKGDELVLMFSP
ncbi:MAG TPA: glycoside hydrolase family 95 protein [Bacteroidales bacterium]|nr:glycoside hydrolase family 95 protein [Bacteroidales bacterium]